SPALTRLIRQSLSTLAHDNHAVVLESRSPPEIYQSPAGFLSAGLFLFSRQKFIKAPQVFYLRGFFCSAALKATNSQQPRRGFGE
ncbi:hypothetical protein KJ940_00475, partial [Myxococcota bacterium]|nr:hypothetical protein [Myxococcota bacterium]